MKGYRQLTLPQRYEIFALKKAGHSQVAIAGWLGGMPPPFLVSFVGIKVRPVTMLRRPIDTLSSAVFNRVVRPSGLGARSGWSKVHYGSNGAPNRSPIG